MSRYSFLRSRRWLGVAALTLVVAAVCALLGTWQLQRHQQRAAEIELVQRNADAAPVPLGDLLTTPDGVLPPDLEWRSVLVTGTYVGTEVALPQRGVADQAADQALGLFRVDGPDGQPWLITVDRGWYPTDAFVDPSDRLALPTGTVELRLRLRPAEPASDRDQIPAQVFRIAPEQVRTAAGDPVPEAALLEGAYGWVASENPTTANPPTPLPVPHPDYRSNLSYAFQWWAFGLMAFVGYGVLARREANTLYPVGARGCDDGHDGDPPARQQPTRRRRPTDAELEDAALDEADARHYASEISSA